MRYNIYSYDGSSFYDHYLSSDEEEGQDNEEEEILEDEVEEESVIIEDLPSHDIWKGKYEYCRLFLSTWYTNFYNRNVERCGEVKIMHFNGRLFNVWCKNRHIFLKWTFFFFFIFLLAIVNKLFLVCYSSHSFFFLLI